MSAFQATPNNQLNTTSAPYYQYDAAGNLSVVPAPLGSSYTYDLEGHLAQVVGLASVGYLYDGDGRRVAKAVGGAAHQLYR